MDNEDLVDDNDLVDYYRATQEDVAHLAVVQTNDFIAIVNLHTGTVSLVKGEE
jgi:hypothetical protein